MFITLCIASANNPTQDHPVIEVDGDTITYNGTEYDLSLIEEGCVAEATYPAVGEVKRINGVIHLNLHYPYDSTKAVKEQSLNIADYQFTVEQGEVPCPIEWEIVDVQA